MKKNPWRFLSAGAVALMLAAPLNFPVSAAGGDVLVTPFTGVEIENSALNVSAEKVQPLGNGLDGSKITIQADLDPIDNKNFVFPGHHNDRAKVITGKGAIAGSTGLVVYVEMPTANKFCFFANINSPHDDRWNNDFDADMMQTVDSAYRLLAPAVGRTARPERVKSVTMSATAAWNLTKPLKAGSTSRGIPCGSILALSWISARTLSTLSPCILKRWVGTPAL